MGNKMNMADGRVFYPLLNGETYGGYGYYSNYNKELHESKDKVPYEEDILVFRGTRTGAELVIGKSRIEKETSPYMDNYFLKIYEDFSECKKITYDVDTDSIEADEDAVKTIFDKENYSNHNDWFCEVSKFVYYVMMYRNPYVYTLFSEYTLESKKFVNNINGRNRWYAIINLWNHIDNLINIEKVAKSVGSKFVFDGILEENFSLNNAKKLHKVIEIPLVCAQALTKLGLEDCLADVRTIAAVDPNYAITLFDFINNFKKAFPGAVYSSKADVGTFIRGIAALMNTGLYNKNFNDLLSFLVNESLNYSEFYLPHREAKELVDYLSVANDMKAANDEVKFERFPKNIQKAHNVMNQNSSILKNPRPEEFKAAVEAQSWLNDEKDENYLFMVPRNEMDLMNEGNSLHHCVASYRDRIIDRGTKVVLMRQKLDPETPFVTIEYDSGIAVQVREIYNADVTDPDILAAVDRWLARAERRERKH